MSRKQIITDEEVEAEIAKLLADPDVKLQKKLTRLQLRRRQYLYGLRNMKKNGEALRLAGFTMENIDQFFDAGAFEEDPEE